MFLQKAKQNEFYFKVNSLLNAPLRQDWQKADESLEKFQHQKLSTTISSKETKDPQIQERQSHKAVIGQHRSHTKLIGLGLVCGSYPQLFRHRHSRVVLNNHPFLLRG